MNEQELHELQEQMAAAVKIITDGGQEIKDLKEAAEKALGAAGAYKTLNDKTLEKVADALKTRPAAYVPDSELKRIGNIQLQAPDLSDQAEFFASKVAIKIGPAVQKAVEDYLENKKFKLTHEHVTKGQLWRYAEESAKRKIRVLIIAVGVLIAGLTTAGILYFNSWVHWGYRLERICNDPRQTGSRLKDGQNIFDLVRREFKKGKKEKEKLKDAIREAERDLN